MVSSRGVFSRAVRCDVCPSAEVFMAVSSVGGKTNARWKCTNSSGVCDDSEELQMKMEKKKCV